MQTKEDIKEVENVDEKQIKKAMFYSVIPSIIIWLMIMTPIVLIYTTYIEPKEIEGSLEIPEWLVMPALFLIIGLLVFI
ncbi:MAG: hypothetical protein AVO38_06600 [delta proteobacterium ML8_D]|jgi:hypothetical protein|nr:MAG: hypothetical protein AVO38_06600 [delta proteobacterium ML8_D]